MLQIQCIISKYIINGNLLSKKITKKCNSTGQLYMGIFQWLQTFLSPWMWHELNTLCTHARSLQLFLTLCDPVNYSSPGSSVHWISQAGILEWVPFPSPGNLPDWGVELSLLHQQAESLLLSYQGSPFSGSI